jgi:hypothetical protein
MQPSDQEEVEYNSFQMLSDDEERRGIVTSEGNGVKNPPICPIQGPCPNAAHSDSLSRAQTGDVPVDASPSHHDGRVHHGHEAAITLVGPEQVKTEDDDSEGDSDASVGVVKITSHDAWAAARATAILKMVRRLQPICCHT